MGKLSDLQSRGSGMFATGAASAATLSRPEPPAAPRAGGSQRTYPVNQFGGACHQCGQDVPAKGGIRLGKIDGRWAVAHRPGRCPAPATVPAPAPEAAPVASGEPEIIIHPAKYTVLTPDGHRTLRVEIQPADAKFAPGQTVIAFLNGPDNIDFESFAFIGGTAAAPRLAVWKRFREGYSEIIAAARQVLAHPDGVVIGDNEPGTVLRTKNCRRCNAELSHPDSIDRGLGPECSRKWAESWS